MTTVNCYLEKCIYCKDNICAKDTITLAEEHYCIGGCDMISLDVENYCQECPKFEPECTKFYYGDGNCTTSISCENRGMCENIKLYIEQQLARKEKSNESDKS